MNLSKEEVEKLVKEISQVKIVPGSMTDINLIHSIVAKIEAGGWKFKVEAYRSLIERTSNGKWLLKKPRYEWRNVARFVRGEEKVWYYNNKADSKAHAMDMQSKYP